ncbi:MAG: cupin, partial [Dehalococcoidia bacterium]|nr:cupin [Dehalococcoidia bacterium]
MSSHQQENAKAETFQEPEVGQAAGSMEVRRPPAPYERFIREQGLPIHEVSGVLDVRDLELAPWKRLGGNAAFIVLDNAVDLLGLQVIEIPPETALNTQRHLYEENYWVVEGEGVTELSQVGSEKWQRFEWHAGSLFGIPLNTNFQLINAGTSRAVLIAGNTAPMAFNIFDNEAFVFENEFAFRERYDEEPDYFTPSLETYATPELGRAMWGTNIIPDIVDCELPLDNQRSPGYRRIEPHMAGSKLYTFIGQHEPAPILLCFP